MEMSLVVQLIEAADRRSVESGHSKHLFVKVIQLILNGPHFWAIAEHRNVPRRARLTAKQSWKAKADQTREWSRCSAPRSIRTLSAPRAWPYAPKKVEAVPSPKQCASR